jgi:hypothetical protein
MKISKKQYCYAVIVTDEDVYYDLCQQEEIKQVPTLCGTREHAEYYANEYNIEWNQDHERKCYCGVCDMSSRLPRCYERVIYKVEEVELYWN